MKRALLEWEYEQYQRNKTRNQRKRRQRRNIAVLVAVATAAVVAAVLAAEASSEPEEEYTPPPVIVAQEPAIIELLPMTEEEWDKMPEMGYEEARAVLLERMPKMEETILTHYCICRKCCGKSPDHPAYGITASGRKAEPYTSVAVDPKIIPLGSTVYIDHGDGDIRVYRADDTGSAIKGAHIDLCVTEHDEARQMGVDTVTVWWEV